MRHSVITAARGPIATINLSEIKNWKSIIDVAGF